MKVGWKHAVFVALAIPFVAKTLATFAAIIQPYLAIRYDLWFELGMVVGQVLFQWLVLLKRTWADRLLYAVIVVGVSTLGAALLWPLLAWNHASPVRPLVAVGWFFGVVAIMFAVHWLLVKRAALPTILCATWVVYRLIILIYVIKK